MTTNKKISIFLFGHEKEDTSWGKTTKYFYETLKAKTILNGFSDYHTISKIKKVIHNNLTQLYFGNPSSRDCLLNFLYSKNAVSLFNRINGNKNVDAFIHTSGLIAPKILQKIAPHFAYFDATISAGLRYSNDKIPGRYLSHFIKSTKKLAENFTAFFTFNQWTKDSLIEEYGFNEKNIYNVGFGANLNPYNGEKDYTNELMLIVLRRGLEELKGLNLLLEAFKIVKLKNNKLKLAVVGTTSENIEGVEYYDGYPREKTIELFQKASLYAMPALNEPNGMVYPEALSCKTPILGLNRFACPEFAGYGKYGFIVNEPDPELVANTILDAMSDPKRLKKMGLEGQKFAAERYNWDNVVDRMLGVMQKYVNESKN